MVEDYVVSLMCSEPRLSFVHTETADEYKFTTEISCIGHKDHVKLKCTLGICSIVKYNQ